jgi:hypothetical protein
VLPVGPMTRVCSTRTGNLLISRGATTLLTNAGHRSKSCTTTLDRRVNNAASEGGDVCPLGKARSTERRKSLSMTAVVAMRFLKLGRDIKSFLDAATDNNGRDAPLAGDVSFPPTSKFVVAAGKQNTEARQSETNSFTGSRLMLFKTLPTASAAISEHISACSFRTRSTDNTSFGFTSRFSKSRRTSSISRIGTPWLWNTERRNAPARWTTGMGNVRRAMPKRVSTSLSIRSASKLLPVGALLLCPPEGGGGGGNDRAPPPAAACVVGDAIPELRVFAVYVMKSGRSHSVRNTVSLMELRRVSVGRTQ